jgi:hypothetical protein
LFKEAGGPLAACITISYTLPENPASQVSPSKRLKVGSHGYDIITLYAPDC